MQNVGQIPKFAATTAIETDRTPIRRAGDL
jgi:hypothetical protein